MKDEAPLRSSGKKRTQRPVLITVIALVFGAAALIWGVNSVNGKADSSVRQIKTSSVPEKPATRQTPPSTRSNRTPKVAKTQKKSGLDALPPRQLKRKSLSRQEFLRGVQEGRLSDKRARFFEIYSDDDEEPASDSSSSDSKSTGTNRAPTKR